MPQNLHISKICCIFAANFDAKEIIMTATLTYNPRNRAAKLAMDYIQSLGVFTITPVSPRPIRKRKEQQFEDEFRTAMKHAKAFREGKMEFRSMDALLSEL